jgi:lipopolysaccharide transport system permease protein
MVMAGMLPWFLFSTVLSNGSSSLVQNANLISKVYFPRLIVPVAGSCVALVDFAITLVMLAIMLLVFGVVPDWRLLLLPLFVVLAIVAALGPALIMASLNVKYRDFRFIVPFVVQFGLYVSPVGFTSNVIPEEWRLLYSLNPVVGVIDGFRWCLLGNDTSLNLSSFFISLAVSMIFLWFGVSTFRRTEKTFADLV